MEDIDKLKQEAAEGGMEFPEDANGGDEIEDVAEVEVIEYGDGE